MQAVCDFLDQWAFMPARKLRPGQAVRLELHFLGKVNTNFLAGLYANTHIDHETGTET